MTVEEFRAELEKVISGLTTSGFDSIDSEITAKLDNLAVTAGELKMNEGKRLIENLSGTMKGIKEGTSKAESGSLRLTALDFYFRKHSEGGAVEEL
ncbi:MAG: hypothetical protein LBH42_10125 [Treponema sp.]|jgi:hypothetical protein|nr:hypothetical protein [Treponema sp.]